eukprot:TRINITY_DN4709_c0_g2_i1.p1 TRINITY_DN4709_c0_g2~~TRINITY_DN4709_c0_g2_i1.p1  ORF type:complete len:322 (+),score=74.95 TRINITY_DN4709_c0_g2_i1:141-1106(+)
MCDEFANDICRAVVAQICQNLNFNSMQASACDALVDILRQYIQQIGHIAHQYAESSSRTEANFLDVKMAFQDMNINIVDLMSFHANYWPDMPFPKAVPPFPVKRKAKKMVDDALSASTTSLSTSSTSSEGTTEANGETQADREHIPDFLPPFPDKRTYVSTAKFKERVVDSRVIRKLKSKRKRQVEQALTAINETLGETPTINYDVTRPAHKVQSLASVDTATGARNNPYLAPAKIQRTTPKPTPLKPNSRYLKYGDDGSVYRQDETPHVTTTASDDAERNKRMLKCEKILSLAHTSGIDQLDAGFDEETASNAGRDDASE